jgi:hypothetical protein
MNTETKVILAGIALLLTVWGAVAANAAECRLPYEGVYILGPTEFAVNQHVNGLEVRVQSTSGENENIKVIAYLKDGATIIKRKDTWTNAEGIAPLDFDKGHTKTGVLVVEVQVGVCPGVDCQTETKEITIKKTLSLLLKPKTITNYVNEEVLIEYPVRDAETQASISHDQQTIMVKQGDTIISYAHGGTNDFTFVTGTIGTVYVEVEVTKAGYISDKKNITVEIGEPTQTTKMYLDGQDFGTIGSDGIGVGYKTIKVEAKKGNVARQVQIEATVRTAAGGSGTPLSFFRKSDGTYESSYDFKEKGKTYYIEGTITDLEDSGVAPQPFHYEFVTLAEGGAGETVGTYVYIGFGVVAVVMMLIVLIVIIAKRKK